MENEARIGIADVQESPPKSKEDKFKNTLTFIEVAFREGAHFKVPKYFTKERWERNLDILLVYILSPDESLDDTGRIFGGITRERARQIRDKTMRKLWLNCLPETQTLFPFEELELEKPLTQKARERKSQARGGRTIFIRDLAEDGKSIQQIKESGVSTQGLTQSRITLKAWGKDLPYINTPHSQNVGLERKLRAAGTDEEKQELLNQVKRRFYEIHAKGENPLLTNLRNIALEAGFSLGFQNQNLPILIASLKNVDFPMVDLPTKHKSKAGEEEIEIYHVFLARDKERAKGVLLADPSLQRFKRS